jgi:hypothetical protein
VLADIGSSRQYQSNEAIHRQLPISNARNSSILPVSGLG